MLPTSDRPLQESMNPRKKCCLPMQSLHSIWYGVAIFAWQAYILYFGISKFLDYLNSKFSSGITSWEVNLYLALQGSTLLLLPILLFSSIFKIGNLANDGFRLGRRIDFGMDLDLPSRNTKSGDALFTISNSAISSAWRHGPALGPSLHAICALCILMANLILDARLIKDNIISRDKLWSMPLDFIFMQGSQTNKGPISITHLTNRISFPEPDFLNYIFALLAYAARCSDVYFGANKVLASLISLQLVANGLTAILVFCGASVLYKVELVDVPTSYNGVQGLLSDYMLLDPPITVMLMLLFSVTLLLSTSPLNMYVLNKLSNFLLKSRRQYFRELPKARTYLWSFYPHLAALATLTAIFFCVSPLLHDCSKLYKLNPQPIFLIAVAGSIVHAFLWVSLWLFLTAKNSWVFQLKISIGKTMLNSPSCLATCAQLELNSDGRKQLEESESLLENTDSANPMLLLASGKAYNILDTQIQNSIKEVIQGKISRLGSDNETDSHRVYFLHGETPNPSKPSVGAETSPNSPSSPSQTLPASISGCGSIISNPEIPSYNSKVVICTGDFRVRSSIKTSVGGNQAPTISGSATCNALLSPIMTRPTRKPHIRIPVSDDDTYAVLRDLPLVKIPMVDHEAGSSGASDCSSCVDSGIGSNSQRTVKKQIRFPSPVVTRDLCNPYGYVKPKMSTFTAPEEIQSNAAQSPFHSLPSGQRNNGESDRSAEIHHAEYRNRAAIQASLFARP